MRSVGGFLLYSDMGDEMELAGKSPRWFGGVFGMVALVLDSV
jgi:hypothetical protein